MRRAWVHARDFLVAIPPVPPQALAAFHASVGVAILTGSAARFSAPAFAGARQLVSAFGIRVDDAWLFWGILLAVVGFVMLFLAPSIERRWPRLALAVVAFGAAPMLFLVFGFVQSLGVSAVASSSPVGAYGSIAVFHIHTAVKMVRHGVWDQRRADGSWERRQSRLAISEWER